MKRVAFVGILVLGSSPAFAQQLQSPFVPYTITEQQQRALLNYLGEQPAKFSMPLINTLTQFETLEQQKKSAADATANKKVEESKKPLEKKP